MKTSRKALNKNFPLFADRLKNNSLCRKKKKMKNHVNKIISVFILLISFALTGCYYYEPSGDIIEIGFRADPDHAGPIFGGIRSKTNTFEIDDVTLDFYVGGEIDLQDFQSVVLYLVNEQKILLEEDYLPPLKVEEYKTSDLYSYMEEIDGETFKNGPFDVSIRFGFVSDNYYFHFIRRLTIPKELFKDQSGRIMYFVALLPKFNEEKGKYSYDTMNFSDDLFFDYTILEDGKVLIK